MSSIIVHLNIQYHTCVSLHSFNPFAKGDAHEKQSKANAFWQATYREEKMKEHMHAVEEEAEESPQYRFNEHSHFDTWGHYKHDYIDSLSPQKSIEQELEGTCSLWLYGSSRFYFLLPLSQNNIFCPLNFFLADLRQQAAQFKALAITEVVGHALAEEALHEAEQRAESCEIAEAVLLGAAADKGEWYRKRLLPVLAG